MNALPHLLRWFKSLQMGTNCPSCTLELRGGEGILCLHCRLELHATEPSDVPVLTEDLAWRLPVRSVLALWWAPKGSPAEAVYKALKFGGRRALGPALGKDMARHWDRTFRTGDKPVLQEQVTLRPDAVVPVPLTLGRWWDRGYNQSELLARGMSLYWQVPGYSHLLRRRDSGTNLARLGRSGRFDRAAKDFVQGQVLTAGAAWGQRSQPYRPGLRDLEGLHLLLVDDVMTSGATLERCGQLLLSRGASLSVMVLARRLGNR